MDGDPVFRPRSVSCFSLGISMPREKLFCIPFFKPKSAIRVKLRPTERPFLFARYLRAFVVVCEKARAERKKLEITAKSVDLTDAFRPKRSSTPGGTAVRSRRNATEFRAKRIGENKQIFCQNKQKFCRVSILNAHEALRSCHMQTGSAQRKEWRSFPHSKPIRLSPLNFY